MLVWRSVWRGLAIIAVGWGSLRAEESKEVLRTVTFVYTVTTTVQDGSSQVNTRMTYHAKNGVLAGRGMSSQGAIASLHDGRVMHLWTPGAKRPGQRMEFPDAMRALSFPLEKFGSPAKPEGARVRETDVEEEACKVWEVEGDRTLLEIFVSKRTDWVRRRITTDKASKTVSVEDITSLKFGGSVEDDWFRIPDDVRFQPLKIGLGRPEDQPELKGMPFKMYEGAVMPTSRLRPPPPK